MKTEIDNMKTFIDPMALAVSNYCAHRVKITLRACFKPLMEEAPLLDSSMKCVFVFQFVSSLLQ